MDLKSFQIENDQIILNILQESDAEDLYIGIKNTLHDLRKFPASLPWAIYEPELESSQAFCRSRIEALFNKENFVFSIRLKENLNFLGVIDIHQIDWEQGTASIGFWGNALYKKNGFMSQALMLFIDALFGRWSFKALNAFTEVENESARALCERANFQLKEILFQSVRNPVDGSWRDNCHYQITNKSC